MFSRILLAFLVVGFFSCKPSESDPEVSKWEAQAENVEIIRDDFGVPHIYGKTDADAVFGLLYAQCEDDFRRVERNYIWAIGRLAELEGESAIYSDVRANLYMTEEEAKQAYEKAPDWLKELCVAFADGVNYYLHTHPEVTPQVITKYEPWMPMFFFEGSIGGDIERISTERLKAFYEQESAVAFWDQGKFNAQFLEEPQGSNGIAIAPELSESGNAMLLINPHTSFYFRPEVHVVSEEGLNAYGAVTWGQFFVYQGFNEKTGWIHTSTFVDFIDEFEEEILEEDGMLLYNYGGEKREVKSQEITLKYKEGEELRSKSFTIYRTHHGPITHKGENGWVATKINWDPVNALTQSYTRTKLNNYAEFKEMMNIRTNSSNNTVFADAEGNIAYFHGNFIPKRNPEFDFSRPVDGSNPATDWKGLHTVDESILILNPQNGWIQNCNSTPFTAAAEFSPKAENYPNYMAPDQENFRGIHAVKVLSEVKKLNLDSFLALAHDSYLPAFQYLIPELSSAFLQAGKGKENLKEAVDLLASWDYRTGLNSVPMSLAHFYGENYQRKFRSLSRFINPSDAKAPEAKAILEVLEETIAQMDADFGTWKTPWGEINRFQRLSGDIDLKYDDNQPYIPVGYASGNWGALAAYGARTFEGTKRLYGYRGNSFVAVVEFGEKVKAKTILAGGQNSDPNSPHFFDQAQRYADTNFKEAAFYREDVEKRAEERYQPGKR
ncbi:acyl-homoserine lactone acylase PvdQ [Algoriphagus boseongensis]|uniref:Acyl-homoserine lactone acylase PvdQ n=1 Tax=Algoriphagus boseongensis TaxID=1442587 RepID=A0A4R6T622_9BACT|nr:penicillin acylase family protein [Algoriphagus boseongensis]TDQ18578.1 acyl-homoserine lactone acylase PvdQ [Algoriphagus boseongensis]